MKQWTNMKCGGQAGPAVASRFLYKSLSLTHIVFTLKVFTRFITHNKMMIDVSSVSHRSSDLHLLKSFHIHCCLRFALYGLFRDYFSKTIINVTAVPTCVRINYWHLHKLINSVARDGPCLYPLTAFPLLSLATLSSQDNRKWPDRQRCASLTLFIV